MTHAAQSWATQDLAEDYDTWDDGACWLLGYPFVPGELGLRAGNRLLDLGCGPGTVTRWFADRHGVSVVATDYSAAMLEIAARQPHPRIDYRLTVADLLPLPDDSVDAAMSCFMFICVPELDRLQRMVAEVRRVLRPGGRFTVLGPNPAQANGEFSGFRRGVPGHSYAAGEPLPVQVRRTDGSWVGTVDVHWPESTYQDLLTGAGFRVISRRTPRLADAAGVADPGLVRSRSWTAERDRAPFLLITGELPG
ncbi:MULTISPECIES: class I SAM-dependent methyltransferase [unclassified Crossiella]|uniref:class I SAM-dependent methyltransferase n=1 Tax=unclassified Crossiella TaxID=2620835 RepID=UPI001FFF9C29|nr:MULTISPECIES: class I SAM-dependent methyltransferase [unclassified Crossiella]MCK2244554.1 class I SAM-dependent methyltransferase [Crossiella sp. S99.2]MCK2258185.1 class I SAM-dependent methyltransferase [Crossiella sp. S99.1]